MDEENTKRTWCNPVIQISVTSKGVNENKVEHSKGVKEIKVEHSKGVKENKVEHPCHPEWMRQIPNARGATLSFRLVLQ